VRSVAPWYLTVAVNSTHFNVSDTTLLLHADCLQVEALEAATRGGGGFNQPQYLHLQEALAAVVASLDALQVSYWLKYHV
jgi:hypothetical protein